MSERRQGHSALRMVDGKLQTYDSNPGYPYHLGELGTEQFTVTTRLNGKVIGEQKIHDPFIFSKVVLRGWRHAWNALFGGLKIEINLRGSEGVSRAIMTLNPYELQAETEKMLAERARSRENFTGQAYTCEKAQVGK